MYMYMQVRDCDNVINRLNEPIEAKGPGGAMVSVLEAIAMLSAKTWL